MYNQTPLKLTICLLFIGSLFSLELSAGIINGSHWKIKSGDSLYKIARSIFPDSTQLQAKLRKALVTENPQIFKNGASSISVGDKLQLPDFAITSEKPAKATEQPLPVSAPIVASRIAATSVPEVKTVKPPEEEIVGKIIINTGNLTAKNQGITRQLQRRSIVYKGDTLSTGDKSLTQVRFKDGALLSLRPHTSIKITDYHYNDKQDGTEKSLLELLKGGFRTITGAIGHINKNNYQVKTNIATIGIRGTHYALVLCQQSSCSGEGTGSIEDGLYGGVADGSIIIKNQSGEHQFNNDQFFQLTSATSEPVRFLYPPAVLKHGAGKLPTPGKETHNQDKKNVSKQAKSAPRRLAVIFEANQPDFEKKPKIAVGDLNAPPVAPPVSEFDVQKAPNGSAAIITFSELESDGTISSTAAAVQVRSNNENTIILGPNRTLIAGSEISTAAEHDPHKLHQLQLTSLDGSLATLVPSSVGSNSNLGVNWGRWNGQFKVLENGTRLDTKDDLHYIYSENLTSPNQLANLGGILGSVSYSLEPNQSALNGTYPTDSNGKVAIEIPLINMNVDFVKQEITQYDISVLVDGNFYDASANGIPFQNINDGFSITSEGCYSGCTGEASVIFVGDRAGGALNGYHIEDAGNSLSVTGTALLTRQGTAPTQPPMTMPPGSLTDGSPNN